MNLAKDEGFPKLKALIQLEQGNMNFYQQKYDAAKTFWLEALATFERNAGDNEYNIMTTRYNLSNLFWETGEKEKSINYCREVFNEMTASRGPLFPFALQILVTLADRQRMNGDLEAAEQNYRLLLQRAKQRFGAGKQTGCRRAGGPRIYVGRAGRSGTGGRGARTSTGH